MHTVVFKLLSEQRKRCLATILNAAESMPGYTDMSPNAQALFREQVRSALQVFYDLTRDVVKVSDDDGPRNDLVLNAIRAMHSEQRQLAAKLDT